jgi:ankyrin repeat protein
MKHRMIPLLLALLSALPLSACAITPLGGQGRAIARLAAMDAEDYFQGKAQIALVEAAGDGDIEDMREALADGADVNRAGRDGMTPLLWAAGVKQNLEGFRFLLEHGADPNTATRLQDDEEPTPIVEIAYYLEDPAYMKALLEHGADPNTIVGRANGTLLFLPLADRRLAQIKLLVEHGADVNHRAKYNETPLRDAVLGTEYKTALVLLRAGADPTLENTNGFSVISAVKSFRERRKQYQDKSSGYPEFIEALKQRGYLDKDF